MKTPKVLVMEGYGINCEYETEHCIRKAGGEAKRVHINDLMSGHERLSDYQMLVMPGGFSFADNLGAAKVWAVKMRLGMMDQIQAFIRKGRPILGVCNGFQAMVKLGILPAIDGNYGEQTVTLTFNENGKFENRWVSLRINPKSSCIFTKGMKSLYVPVRHGEGRFLPRDRMVLEKLRKGNQIVAQYAFESGRLGKYPENPNGSIEGIAALCDPTGRLFGIMPHPEAYSHRINHPRWTREKLADEGQGIAFFRNAVGWMQEHF